MTTDLDRRVHELLGYCVHSVIDKTQYNSDDIVFFRLRCAECGEYLGVSSDGSVEEPFNFPSYSTSLNLTWPILEQIEELACEIVIKDFHDDIGGMIFDPQVLATNICEWFVNLKSNTKVQDVM